MLENAHDIVLLDRMLPRMDGAAVLSKAREQGVNTPVMMITALGSLENRIEGLDLGADDYIVKPFEVQELLARIRAIRRRPRTWDGMVDIQCGDLILDSKKLILRHGDKSISLSKKEAALLEVFLKNPGNPLPRGVLFSHVWGPDAGVEDGNLDSYVYFIRQRLSAVNSPLSVVTIRQVGYCLQDKAHEGI
jgi:DNA-binding response OmpR family regulator